MRDHTQRPGYVFGMGLGAPTFIISSFILSKKDRELVSSLLRFAMACIPTRKQTYHTYLHKIRTDSNRSPLSLKLLLLCHAEAFRLSSFLQGRFYRFLGREYVHTQTSWYGKGVNVSTFDFAPLRTPAHTSYVLSWSGRDRLPLTAFSAEDCLIWDT